MKLCKTAIVLISFIFLNAGRPNPLHYSRLITPTDLEPLVMRYMEACEYAGRNCAERLDTKFSYLRIGWAEKLPNGHIGLCHSYRKIDGLLFVYYGTVFISTSLKKMDPEYLYLTLAHEMEHCLRRVDHSDKDSGNLMSEFIMTATQFMKKFGSADRAVHESFLNNAPDQW